MKKNEEINEYIKTYSKTYFKIFSEKPKVVEYLNDDETKSIDILSVQFYDYPNIVFYSTLGLANIDFGISSNNKSLRIELICAFYKDYEYGPNLLAQAAFECIDTKKIEPNFIISEIGKENGLFKLPNIWIKYPNLLPKENLTHEFENIYITLLQVLPISENEKKVLLDQSSEVLEKLFMENDIDQFNPERESKIN